MRDDAPALVGFAACTSLGYTLESTLAAMGAGLTNFSDTQVRGTFGDLACAARVPAIPVETARAGRLAALLRAGLHDLTATLAPVTSEPVPIFVGLASDLDDAETDAVTGVLAASRMVTTSGAWRFPYGRSSAFAALRAGAALVAGGAECVVVCGVDSLCAAPTVRALAKAERVLGPGTEGTIPGEAATFAVLVAGHHAAADAETAVRLDALALQRSDTPITQAANVSADGLTSAFRALRESGAARVDRVIAAHSGEGYFGRCFSHAYLRETELMPEPLRTELIADRVGDIGAAAAMLGIAFAAYLMVRDAKPTPSRALVYSESDLGAIGAAIVEGTPTAWARTSGAAVMEAT